MARSSSARLEAAQARRLEGIEGRHPEAEALEQMETLVGKQFDPALFALFKENLTEIRAIREEVKDDAEL